MRHAMNEPRQDSHSATSAMMNDDSTGSGMAHGHHIAQGITPMTREESEWLRDAVECSPAWVLTRAVIGLVVIAFFSSGSLPESVSIHPYAISAHLNH